LGVVSLTPSHYSKYVYQLLIVNDLDLYHKTFYGRN